MQDPFLSQRRMLLISNSYAYRKTYLEHVLDIIGAFLLDARRVTLLPFADCQNINKLAITAESAFKKIGKKILNLNRFHPTDMPSAIAESEAIFVAGGNTWWLTEHLQRYQLLDPIRNRVNQGMPYIGVSAGSIVACPEMRTTNDTAITWLPSPITLGIFPHQINPHYYDPDPGSTHQGESRATRMIEFTNKNPDKAVIGLRENCWIVVNHGKAALRSNNNVTCPIFLNGKVYGYWQPGPVPIDLSAKEIKLP